MKKIILITFLVILLASLSLFVSSTIKRPSSNNPSIVAHWTFEQNSSTAILDNSTNNRDLTIIGDERKFSSSILPGLGSAYFFNGSNAATTDHLRTTDATFKFVPADSFSISGWIKTNQSTGYTIIDGFYSGVTGGYIIDTNSDTLRFIFDISITTSLSAYTEGDLTFFVATYKAGIPGNRTLYINSTRDILRDADSDNVAQGSGTYFDVGYRSGTNSFNGTMDEIIVWNKALPLYNNTESVLELFNDYTQYSRAIDVNITFNSTGPATIISNSSDVNTTIVNQKNLIKINNTRRGYVNIILNSDSSLGNIYDINNSRFFDFAQGSTGNITTHIYNGSTGFYIFKANKINLTQGASYGTLRDEENNIIEQRASVYISSSDDNEINIASNLTSNINLTDSVFNVANCNLQSIHYSSNDGTYDFEISPSDYTCSSETNKVTITKVLVIEPATSSNKLVINYEDTGSGDSSSTGGGSSSTFSILPINTKKCPYGFHLDGDYCVPNELSQENILENIREVPGKIIDESGNIFDNTKQGIEDNLLFVGLIGIVALLGFRETFKKKNIFGIIILIGLTAAIIFNIQFIMGLAEDIYSENILIGLAVMVIIAYGLWKFGKKIFKGT